MLLGRRLNNQTASALEADNIGQLISPAMRSSSFDRDNTKPVNHVLQPYYPIIKTNVYYI